MTKLFINRSPVHNLQTLAEEVLLWFYSGVYRSPEPCCATIDQTSNKISTTGSLTSTPWASSVTGYFYQSDLRVMYKQKTLRELYVGDQGKCPARLSVVCGQASWGQAGAQPLGSPVTAQWWVPWHGRITGQLPGKGSRSSGDKHTLFTLSIIKPFQKTVFREIPLEGLWRRRAPC